MNRKAEFVARSLDDLIRNDEEVRSFFTSEDGKPLDPKGQLYRERRGMLEETLAKAYDSKLERYEKKGFFQKYVATPLRYLAGGAYAAGAALFAGLLTPLGWATGPAGFGMTGIGAGLSALADLIDSYSYIRRKQIKWKHLIPIWAEGLPEKALGYLPIGTGLIDLYRSRGKFDFWMRRKLKPLLEETVDYAKSSFLRKLVPVERVREPYVIPLSRFRDERYVLQKAAA